MKISKTMFLAALVTLVAFPAFAQPKIAIVDLRKVFEDYYKTKAANATLKDYVMDLEKDHKSLLEEHKKAKEDYTRALADSNNMAISAEERDKSKKIAEAKFKELQDVQQTVEQFERRADVTVREKERQMRDKILEEIRTVVNAQAKAGGFSLVVDSAAETINKTPFVLFTSGDHDITSAVLAQLNATAPPTTSKADDKGRK